MKDKENRNIKLNRPQLDKETIDSFQDYNDILKKHQSLTKKPKYNQRKFWLGFSLVVVIALIIISDNWNPDNKNTEFPKADSTQTKIDTTTSNKDSIN